MVIFGSVVGKIGVARVGSLDEFSFVAAGWLEAFGGRRLPIK